MFTRSAYLDVYTFQLVIVIIIIFFAAHLRTMLRRLPYFGAQQVETFESASTLVHGGLMVLLDKTEAGFVLGVLVAGD